MQRLDAAKNRLRGAAIKLLMGDGLDQRLEGRLHVIRSQATGAGGVHDAGQHRVGLAEMSDGAVMHSRGEVWPDSSVRAKEKARLPRANSNR